MQQCLNCGRELTADAIARGYCPSCGAPVTAQPAAPTPPAYPSYTPPATGGYGQPTYSQPLAYQGQPAPDQPQQPAYPGQPVPDPAQQPGYPGQSPNAEPPQQPAFPVTQAPLDPSLQPPAYVPPAPYPPTGTPPAYPQGYPPASTPYPGQQYPPSSAYPGQPGGEATPGYPPAYPQPSMPYQPGVTGAYPQQPGTGAYPQQPGTGGYYPPQGTGAYPPGTYPGYPPAPAQPARSGNNSAIIGLIVALVVVVLLAGTLFILGKSGSGPLAGVFPTATPVATNTPVPTNTPIPTATPSVPTPPAGFKAFTSSDGAYGVDYPSAWIQQSQGSETLFGSADGNNTVFVIPNGREASASLLQSILDGLSMTGTKVDASTTSVTAGANTWTAISGSGVLSGTPYTMTLYSTDNGGSTYNFITLAPTASVSSVNTADFQPMLKSFTFLK